ncbi:MAG: ribonuclease HI [Anaerolineales bacterium]
MAKNQFYAVVKGRKPGIYQTWFGENGAEIQVKGFPGAIYKGFPTEIEARRWLDEQLEQITKKASADANKEGQVRQTTISLAKGDSQTKESKVTLNSLHNKDKEAQVIIYTDGACINNPGSGGYGVVILRGGKRAEYSGGFSQTTNNRMELMACIVGLEHVPSGSSVKLYSDSQYVVNGIQKGWAKRWRERGWLKMDGKPAENRDLWARLLDLCEQNQVELIWLRGHIGDKENERCNRLAQKAASQPDNPADQGYRG